jgi:maltose alpha-D-glucosyltransferase/alpha-amylase
VIDDAWYGFEKVSVERQRRDPDSLLNWMERKIRMRRECPEISWGDWKILKTSTDGVLAIQYSWNGSRVTTIHNFAEEPRVARISDKASSDTMVDLLTSTDSRPDKQGRHVIELEPYGYRWFRSGGIDHIG